MEEALQTIRGFQTFVYNDDGLQLRFSGDFVVVSHAKLLGPFRLGFAYSLSGRDITVEVFHGAEIDLEPKAHTSLFNRVLASLKPSFNRVLASLMPGQDGVVIAHAQFRPFRVIQHQGSQAIVIFEAAVCRTKPGLTKAVCKDGKILVGGSDVPFREWSYDGQNSTLRTISG